MTTPTQQPRSSDREAFDEIVARLNDLSVEQHHDAYADVGWDDPEMQLSVDDPRMRLPAVDPLAHSDWYLGLSPQRQAEVAMFRIGSAMQVGTDFENILQQGLLRFARRLPNNRPEFRYVHHEIAEESQHSMMFREFVDRTGLPIEGMPRWLTLVAEQVIAPLSHLAPALFFVFVLGGEEPADQTQRRMLRDRDDLHPLVERIVRIHVLEEARHLSFAQKYLRRTAPRLGRGGRVVVVVGSPFVLGIMARILLNPTPAFRRRYRIPRDVLDEARSSPEGRQLLRDSVARTRGLLHELGLIPRTAQPLWRVFGIWDDPGSAVASGAPAGEA